MISNYLSLIKISEILSNSVIEYLSGYNGIDVIFLIVLLSITTYSIIKNIKYKRINILLQSIMDNTPICIFIKSSPTKYLFVNKAYKNLISRSQKSLPLWNSDTLSWFDIESEVFSTGNPKKYRHNYLVDGVHRCVDITLNNVSLPNSETAIIGTLSDITQSNDSLKTIDIAEKKYKHLVEATNDIIFSLDRNLILTYCSPQVYHLLGHKPKEIQGVNCLSWVKKPRELKKLFSIKKPFIYLLEMECPSTIENIPISTLYLEVSISPIVENGLVKEWNGVARDVTTRVLLEKEIEKKQRILLAVQHGISYLYKHETLNEGTSALLSTLGMAIDVESIYLLQYKEDSKNYLELFQEWNKNRSVTWESQGNKRNTYYNKSDLLEKLNSFSIQEFTEELEDTFIFCNSKGRRVHTIIIPIYEKKLIWGIAIFNRCQTKEELSEDELSVLSLAVTNIGAYITIKSTSEELLNITKLYNTVCQNMIDVQNKESDLIIEKLSMLSDKK